VLKQSDVQLSGWAVETRVYARTRRNFLPSVGRLVRYRPPRNRRRGVSDPQRHLGYSGEISIFYDPMIAKLITHAPTRSEAVAAQVDALDAFTVEGVRHNITFLTALMLHARWQSGMLSTAFLAEEFPNGFQAVAPRGETARMMVAVAAAIDHVAGGRPGSGQQTGRAVIREGGGRPAGEGE
jgi:propionyl-CoA carboxylase alpha chain